MLRTFDLLGSLVFAVFLGFLLLAVNRGNSLAWSSRQIRMYAGSAL
eukprot:SAG31_NODE_22452_length_525_cov_0.758216_2_plen_45_part_01